ncbi:phosphoethanolamine transferase CptA [Alcanivorax sp. S6407]|uniref:phosphoethanolamine transferase CptA n=1 Tax=Alcanivorax sp. S6407 TaxID=2926424 RepID=UPI001FF1971A|nr:phosphoethanolamine transferase CptA [Alcanivorax sp. S6407]MCK0155516.1 phosphoethanolamine transferase CptA [Alcanivorax sp. S6407]
MRNFAQRHPLLWAYLFFLYFSAVPQLLIHVSGMSGTVGTRQAIIMSLLWLVPVLAWPKHVRVWSAVVGVVLWCASLVGFCYWLVFGQDFSQSVIFIIFESNTAESMEFVSSYLNVWLVLAVLVFSLVPLWMWRQISVPDLTPRYRYRLGVVLALVVSWPFLGSLLVKQEGLQSSRYHQVVRMEPAAPWNLVFGYMKYRDQLAAMEAILSKNSQVPPLEALTEAQPDAEKTLVLVVGESTNRQRMSLYGYDRDTTPRLDAMKDELVVFDDVVTARPYTIEALQQALSFADSTDTGAFFEKPTLLNMMKQAGYEVTWITNQQTQTKRNTMLTTMSQMADNQVYLNNNRAQNANQYDEEVLAPFREVIAESGKKKMIIVHLLGTHRKYDYRYPESFRHFNGRAGVPEWVADGNLEEYNQYDDAVRYNDYVVSSLIEALKGVSGQALLMYFSDHGEEVYDYPEPFCGRNEYEPSPAMYTVPFIAWANSDYSQAHGFDGWQAYRHRPYSTANFIYTWADAAQLDFATFEPHRSVISSQFQAMPRLIGDPTNPDTLRDYSAVFPRQTEGSEFARDMSKANRSIVSDDGG